MSDKETPRTPEEVAASVAKAHAEAERARAEARKADAEAVAAEQNARKLLRTEENELAGDDHHFVYRFNDAVGASSVTNCVKTLNRWSRQSPGQGFEIVFSSPGGSIIDGFVLFDSIRELSRQGHEITTGVHGMAASMAGILVQAGDHRWIGKEAWYMIHRAAFGSAGKTYEVEDQVDWVKRIEKRIIDIFTERTALTPQKIKRNWDRKDWWIDSDEALKLELVDEIR